ncbi:MAG: hypothetical protein HRT73_15630, partial [Flavobacteriales bacterium]|nr:hypothetical protein [Flavobacteriales bacterium]
AYNGPGHVVSGDLTATNSATGTGSGIYIGNGATSTLNINGNVSLTQNGSATTLATYLGEQGDITINGTVDLVNSGTGTTSDMRIANNTNSSVIIADTTTITNNSTATTTNRMYIGNQGDITFNGTLNLINNSGVTNSEIYCNNNVNSNNLYNQNITVSSTNATSDGIRFGQSNGVGILAATKTITIGGSGFIAGDLEFRNFTQTGNTTQTLTLTNTARIYNYDANWGGDVTFIAPRNLTRGTLYNRTAYIEKTGASDDQSVGGNTFTMNADFVNSGSGYLMMGNGTFDTYSANVTLTNSGTDHMFFANNGSGHVVSGDLTATNSATGTNNYIYLSNNTTTDLIVNGNTTINNSGTATGNSIYVGNNGDITFNGTLDLNNIGSGADSEIFCNLGINSLNLYNDNIIVASTNADGIRFGQNGGTSTLAATRTITVGGGGFTTGELRLRNFTQTGTTAQNLTLTGTGYLNNYNSNWDGDVTFVAPRNATRGTIYNRTAYLEKTGTNNDASAGGNIFNGNTAFLNSGTGYFMPANGIGNDFNGNVTYTKTNTGLMYPSYNSSSTYAGDITVNSNATIRFGAAGNGRIIFDGTSTQSINSIGVTPTPEM